MEHKSVWKKLLKSLLFYVMLILVWYAAWYVLVEVTHTIKPYLFLSPFEVMRAIVELFAHNNPNDPDLLLAIAKSLGRLFVGFFISVGVACILTVILQLSKGLYGEFKSLISGIQTLPNVCWLPFAIILCGLGDEAIYFVIIMGSSFAMALSFDYALKNIDPIYKKAAKTMGCNVSGVFFHVSLHAAMPNVISGLKSGWAFAWRALMASEILQSKTGLGNLLTYFRDQSSLVNVIAIMIVIIFIGVFFEKLVFGKIENRIMRRRGISSD